VFTSSHSLQGVSVSSKWAHNGGHCKISVSATQALARWNVKLRAMLENSEDEDKV
jgi:hypothetical protein